MINEDVVVVFENCEVVRIPKSCMSSIWISGITEDVAWTPQMDTHISKYAKEARISIEHASDGVMSLCTKYKDVTQNLLDGVT